MDNITVARSTRFVRNVGNGVADGSLNEGEGR